MDLNVNTTISLGSPVTVPCLIPIEHKATPTCIDSPFLVDGKYYKVTAMSFGSPHGVVIVDDIETTDVLTIGSSLGNHKLFPKGANIVFIQILNKETIKAKLWQNNESEIKYTPEAVCVAGTAAMMLQKILTNKVNVIMNGNTFQVNWNRSENDVSYVGKGENQCK